MLVSWASATAQVTLVGASLASDSKRTPDSRVVGTVCSVLNPLDLISG